MGKFDLDIEWLTDWNGPKKEEEEVIPEEVAYGKYLDWKWATERTPHDFGRDDVMWGEASDRGIESHGECPLSEDELRLAGKWAKFIGDRHFMFKEYLPFC